MVLIVTGGIGSGKSQVCRILTEQYGIPVYEADRRVKALYTENPRMLENIESAVGLSLRDDAGSFAAQKLAEIIFSDADALGKVEEIVFPCLKQDFAAWAEAQDCEVVAFESATVLEKPQFEGFGDMVLLIDAPVELRLTRASMRDGVDKVAVQRRMAVQKLMNRISDGEACPRVNHVIVNDSTIAELTVKLNEFIEKYGLTKML